MIKPASMQHIREIAIAFVLVLAPLWTSQADQGAPLSWQTTEDGDSFDINVKASDGTILFLACLTNKTKGGIVLLHPAEPLEDAEESESYPISFVGDGKAQALSMTIRDEALIFEVKDAKQYLSWTLFVSEIARANELSAASPDLGFVVSLPTTGALDAQKNMFAACGIDSN